MTKYSAKNHKRHTAMLKQCVVIAGLLAGVVSTASASDAFYDKTWHRTSSWAGEYPNGFTVAADSIINIRASLDLNSPKSMSCQLLKGATYHPWNDERVKSDKLQFVSFTKIETFALKTNFTTRLQRKSDGRNVVVRLKKGDLYLYLNYGAEGIFVIRYMDTVYEADQNLAVKSVQVAGPSGDGQYHEWVNLRCANGVVGWIFVNELKDNPGFPAAETVQYGVAEDSNKQKPKVLSCSPRDTTARILAAPSPNALHHDWTGDSGVGTSWSLMVNRADIRDETGNVYLQGNLVSPRGGVVNTNIFVLEKEWQCGLY